MSKYSLYFLILIGLFAFSLVFAEQDSEFEKIIQISPNGSVLLRGIVEDINEEAIMVMSWGGKWTVRMSPQTAVLPQVEKGKNNSQNLEKDDLVGVKGSVTVE